MSKYIYLVVGPSGSGKTTVVSELCRRYGYRSVNSFTTRPRRYSGEQGHIFVTKSEFDELRPKMCAYTLFDGNEYGATSKQVSKNDFYVIDEAGIEYFAKHYKEGKQPVIVYIDASEEQLKSRMASRGDNTDQIKSRQKVDAGRKGLFNRFKEIPCFYVMNNELEETITVIKNFMSLREG